MTKASESKQVRIGGIKDNDQTTMVEIMMKRAMK
jgi:hypothetical protein